MWKSFLTSIGLLAIALLAALYSSSAGRDGRVLSAGLSALIALGIAVWVGIKFVPRLASHVDWEWLPFLSHYQVTREGWMYFCTVTVVIFAAINTANNLLYMVLSALLAVLVLSGFLSALNFRMLHVAIRVPSHCYSGEPFPIGIQVLNEKRVFATFSISLAPSDDSPFRFSPFYIAVLRALEKLPHTGQCLLTKRGRYTLREVKISSRHPFGFFLKDRKYDVDAECICYPEIVPQEELNLSSIDPRGTYQRFERGLGQDLYTIRDYISSDSARHVHWKASAKTSSLKTREYAAEDTRRVSLVFDRFCHPGDIEQFERLVSYAASLAFYLIQDGIEVKFVTDDWDGNTIEPILEYLALVQPSSSPVQLPQPEDAVLVSLRSR
jgi:uncharacterized protein (DUF58 family)